MTDDILSKIIKVILKQEKKTIIKFNKLDEDTRPIGFLNINHNLYPGLAKYMDFDESHIVLPLKLPVYTVWKRPVMYGLIYSGNLVPRDNPQDGFILQNTKRYIPGFSVLRSRLPEEVVVKVGGEVSETLYFNPHTSLYAFDHMNQITDLAWTIPVYGDGLTLNEMRYRHVQYKSHVYRCQNHYRYGS